nr:hypothetical protein [Frigoriglobus tundricola]
MVSLPARIRATSAAPEVASLSVGSTLIAAAYSFSASSSRSTLTAHTACVRNSSRYSFTCVLASARARSDWSMAGASLCGAFRHWSSIRLRKKWSSCGAGSGWVSASVTGLALTSPSIVRVTAPASGLATLPITSVARSARSGGNLVGYDSPTSSPNRHFSGLTTGTSRAAFTRAKNAVRWAGTVRSSCRRTTAPPVRAARPCRLCASSFSPSGTAKKYTSARSNRLPSARRSVSVTSLYALSPSPRYSTTWCRPRFGARVATAFSTPPLRSAAPEPYSISVSADAASSTLAACAGWKSRVSARVVAGVLSAHTLTRSSADRPAASAAMMFLACWRGRPAWLAVVSTSTSTSRGRGAGAATAGWTCQANSTSPSRGWYVSTGNLLNRVATSSSTVRPPSGRGSGPDALGASEPVRRSPKTVVPTAARVANTPNSGGKNRSRFNKVIAQSLLQVGHPAKRSDGPNRCKR